VPLQNPHLIGLSRKIVFAKGLWAVFQSGCVRFGGMGLERHTAVIVRRMVVILCKARLVRWWIGVDFLWPLIAKRKGNARTGLLFSEISKLDLEHPAGTLQLGAYYRNLSLYGPLWVCHCRPTQCGRFQNSIC
jgi:hypothetical protein